MSWSPVALVAVVCAATAVVAAGVGVGMPNEQWSRPVIVDSIADVRRADAAAAPWDLEYTADGAAQVFPHPAAPNTHIQPVYAQEPTEQEVRWAPGSAAWRRWIAHPIDGSPFRPLYVDSNGNLKQTPRQRVTVPRLPPTVMSPFVKPERVVGSHYPAIPDEACACEFAVSDPRLCTKWVRAPKYECVVGTAEECVKYAPAPVRNVCPCVHADNHRRCYFWAPPGTRAQDYPQRAWPADNAQLQQPQPQPQPTVVRPSDAPKTPSNVRIPTVQPTQPAQPVVQRPPSDPKTPSNVRVPTMQPADAKTAKPQEPAKPFDPKMVVSPHKTEVAGSDSAKAAAAKMKAKVKAAKVAAVKRAMEKRVAAYREAAINRYNAKRVNQEIAAQRRRDIRTAAKAFVRSREAGFTPVALVRPLSLPSANRHTAATRNARITLKSNGNARPSRRGVAVIATEYDKDILTRTVYGEAQHDDAPGQRAVVWALINRARDAKHRFPKALADVCKQRGQFRTWAKPQLRKEAQKIGHNSIAYKAVRRVVDDALAGRSVDPTKGALFYYYNGRVAPGWATDMDCSFVSKVHTFCRPRVQRADIA